MLYQSKLTKPVYVDSVVDRARLYARLDTWRDVRAIVIQAPAGYGKSLLVSRWIDVAGLNAQSVWLSLDQDDADPRTFLHYVAAAIDRYRPGATASVEPILSDTQGTLQQVVARIIATLNDSVPVSNNRQHLLLVLDDLHCVDVPEINELVMTLLKHGPATLHLCMLTRHATGLELARLVAHEQVSTLSTADLRFNSDEIRAYIASRGLASPTPSELAEITAFSEGWITALQLAMLSLAQGGDAGALADALRGNTAWLAAFLTEEVLRRQTPAQQRFLLQTSILDSFNASLCTAVTGEADAYARLAAISSDDLFLIPLDGERDWFRYHHLFQDLLQHHLSTREDQATLASLHRLAAAWLADAGRVVDAVRHWLAAGDADEAADLIETSVRQLLTRAPHEARYLITRLPQATLRQYPRLMLDRCFLAILRDDRQMHVYLEEAEETLRSQENDPGVSPAGNRELQVLEATVALRHGKWDRVRVLTESVEPYLGALSDHIGGLLMFLTMHLRYLEGDQPAAVTLGEGAIGAFDRVGLVNGTIAVRRSLARWAMNMGDHQKATERFSAIFAGGIGDNHSAASELAVAYLHAADNCYWQNQLDRAQTYRQEAMVLADRLQNYDLIQCATAMRRLHDQIGPSTERSRPEDMVVVPDARTSFVSHSLYSLFVEWETRRLILQGRPDLAWRTIQLAGLNSVDPEISSQSSANLSYLCAYLARGVEPAKIAPLLSAALDDATRAGRRFHRLRLLALLAWQQTLLGQEEAVERTTVEVVQLAHETGYVRVLLEMAAFSDALSQSIAEEIGDSSTASTVTLTEQENRVLALLAAGRTYQQIAEELVISPNTVRTHTQHVYRKFGVRRRDQALAKARRMGLLPGRRHE